MNYHQIFWTCQLSSNKHHFLMLSTRPIQKARLSDTPKKRFTTHSYRTRATTTSHENMHSSAPNSRNAAARMRSWKKNWPWHWILWLVDWIYLYIKWCVYLENLAPKIFGAIRKHKKYWRINKNTVHLQKHGAIGKTWRTHAKSHHSTKDNFK